MSIVELTARQCMLVCKLMEESKINPALMHEYAEIMDIFLIEREGRRKEETNNG